MQATSPTAARELETDAPVVKDRAAVRSRLLVLLDRDGILVEPVPRSVGGVPEGPLTPKDVVVSAASLEALRRLRQTDALLALVSNQPGAAKGEATIRDLHDVHARFIALLERAGLHLDHVAYCYHHPSGVDPVLGIRCTCRKPEPGLLTSSLTHLGARMSDDIWMVGDTQADIAAGRRVNARTVLVQHPKSAHRRGPGPRADFSVATFLEAADLISRLHRSRPIKERCV